MVGVLQVASGQVRMTPYRSIGHSEWLNNPKKARYILHVLLSSHLLPPFFKFQSSPVRSALKFNHLDFDPFSTLSLPHQPNNNFNNVQTIATP